MDGGEEARGGEGALANDLRRELSRLQEREALLTHLLSLEREKRVKAEQLIEAEHQACLELGQRLGRERKKVAAVIRKRQAAKLELSCSEEEEAKALASKTRDDGISLQEDGGESLRMDESLKVRCGSLSLSPSISPYLPPLPTSYPIL